ncbi:MAG: phenylalanine 4-monooxygenase, partial [Kiloniellales bacterium]|nr:phenylalanine 4-monooxygenase [Kiloniellales bacterium]
RAKVPQVSEVSARLSKLSGMQLEPVPALISPQKFFELLAEGKFPIATFIRRREDFDYLEEPDVFHEIFGHCPLLTSPEFAEFVQKFGRAAITAGPDTYWPMQRLFWFTVEFGLIEGPEGPRIYGAGILSSPGETLHALESKRAIRRRFDLLSVLRTPYRIDVFQPIYYVITDFTELQALFELDLQAIIRRADDLGPMDTRELSDGKRGQAA